MTTRRMLNWSEAAGRAQLIAAATAGCLLIALGPGVWGAPDTASAAPPPAPGMTCPPVNLWGYDGGTGEITEFTPDGTEVSSVPAARAYGDIAWSADGNTLYGVGFYASPVMLFTIDPSTGAETAATPITGVPEGISSVFNGLSALPNGQLIAQSAASVGIYQIDPATGVTTQIASMNGGGAGDSVTLPDGDSLVLGTGDPGTSHLYRLHSDNTLTDVGTTTLQPWGFAQSGGEIYLFVASDGSIRKLSTVPTTPSSDPLSATTVRPATAGSSFWGATSIQDSGLCNVSADTSYGVTKTVSPSGPVAPGTVVTYRVDVANTGSVAYPATAAGFSDDLGGVLDDATYVPGSATASAGGVTVNGNELSWIGPLAATGDPGSTVTVTYQVRVNDPRTGDAVLANSVSPTGAGGSCSSPAACSTTLAVTAPPTDTPPTDTPPTGTTPPGGDDNDRSNAPEPRLRLRKTVDRARVRAGGTATFTIRVSNPSGRTLRNVRVCDRPPDGLVFVRATPRARVSRGRYCWTIRRLPAHESRALRVTVRALAGTSGRKLSRATATAPDARRGRASAAITVLPAQVPAGGVTG